jgi:hypothetical protein
METENIANVVGDIASSIRSLQDSKVPADGTHRRQLWISITGKIE